MKVLFCNEFAKDLGRLNNMEFKTMSQCYCIPKGVKKWLVNRPFKRVYLELEPGKKGWQPKHQSTKIFALSKLKKTSHFD